MKNKIKEVLIREYEIAKFNVMLIINVTKIQLKDLFNKIKPSKFIENKTSIAQYKIPSVKIVGDVTKEEIEEIHDAFVDFVTNKYFKDYHCHEFRFKGDTYIRIDEPKKSGYIDMSELYEFANKKTDKTFASCFSRDNYSRYTNK